MTEPTLVYVPGPAPPSQLPFYIMAVIACGIVAFLITWWAKRYVEQRLGP